jgi:hypothetical protein
MTFFVLLYKDVYAIFYIYYAVYASLHFPEIHLPEFQKPSKNESELQNGRT